ncbi:MAG: response regulator [Lachnospiraceae bacterium]|nr:response regulator [Lachnospiraceae bacterium]
MSPDSTVNILKLPYGEVQPNGKDTQLIKDYDGSYKVLLAMRNEASGFAVYAVSGVWSIYGNMVVYGLIILALFLVCTVMIYKLLSGMINWQEAASRQLERAAEEAVAAGNAKGRFLAHMSHEIRTPINAVLGMNEMILRESSNESVLGYSEKIRMAGTNLLTIINDILDFSKIEDGKMEIIDVDYSPAEMIANIANGISERAKKKGLQLIMNVDRTIPSKLRGDEVRIKQVITNILTNAVKYTEKGSVTFSMNHEAISDSSDEIMLKVSVKDTGIGIKAEDMKRLFSEFERIDEKRNRNVEGTGLGMSITMNLLEMMESTLIVDSVYGEGSEFSFSLKQKVISKSPMGNYEIAYNKIIRQHKKYTEKFTAPDARVLVVDDNIVNLQVFEGLLKRTLLHVDSAKSGDEGLSLTRENKYDMLFLDHMMPGKDGIEMLHELKAEEGNMNRETVAVCLTANAISGAREEYMAAGFDDYLSKPINFKVLEEMLLDYLPEDKIMVSRSGT